MGPAGSADHCMDLPHAFPDLDQTHGARLCWREGRNEPLAATAQRLMIMMALVTFATWAGLFQAQAQERAQQLPSITLTAGLYRITAEVARTPEQRAIGLMHRTEMPQHAGMLFVFERPEPLCFWMKNTLIPLSIAFLEDDGTIINVREMKPLSLESQCSERPARWALEMNAGWFSKRGLKPGDRISGEPFMRR